MGDKTLFKAGDEVEVNIDGAWIRGEYYRMDFHGRHEVKFNIHDNKILIDISEKIIRKMDMTLNDAKIKLDNAFARLDKCKEKFPETSLLAFNTDDYAVRSIINAAQAYELAKIDVAIAQAEYDKLSDL